ncbi:MAG: HD domain-containing protein [Nanoarchaeota archaeon]|nr:HD domain-containing protein [Nanoarchaeota archaeon]MBU1321863.1 HD domain-containing protein [Nanoarchaeota archaeon]MBU2441907.1 HD domain-containing protein [Nanoarchaeota archaeon]
MNADYSSAINQALELITRKLSPDILYHNKDHTLYVLSVVTELAKKEGISQENIFLLQTGAAYHDTGYIYQSKGHELKSIEIAQISLPDFGFNTNQIDIISNNILATQIPQNPKNILEKITCDADLYHLGSRDFFLKNEILRKELRLQGINFTPRQWMEENISFFEKTHYFTKTAIEIRQPKKEENLRLIKELIGIEG